MLQGYSVIGLLAGLGLAAVYIILTLLAVPHDSREPPLLKPNIPIFGHFIGIIKHGMNYYTKLSKKNKVQLFTLHFGTKRAYVATSTQWIVALQKNFRTISFDPVLEFLGDKLATFSPETIQLFREQGTGPRLLKAMRPTLLPGRESNELNATVMKELTLKLEDLAKLDGQVVDIIDWLRDAISHASTNAVYGPYNPMKDPKLMNDFYIYESSMILFIFSIPSIFHSKSVQSRQRLFKAFGEYFENGHASSGSAMAKARLSTQLEDGLTIDEIGRAEATNLSGILANAIPVTFWMFYTIYSRPKLLAQIREELNGILIEADEEDDKRELYFLNVSDLKTRTPLLVSVFQEVLRVRAISAAIRILTEDTTVASPSPNSKGQYESYLLKKGSIVQMPAESVHLENDAWGNDATEFDERRFLSKAEEVTDGSTPSTKRRNPASFRSFGGGDHICPGRHFAAAEILCLISIIILTYDATPTDEKGDRQEWQAPPPDTNKAASAIAYPQGRVHTILRRRNAQQEVRSKWSAPEGELAKGFKLIVG